MEDKTNKLKGKRVLVVDDNMMNIMVVKVILSEYEITLSEATNGDQAVAFLEKNPTDLILMDLKMPVLDGFQATNIIRKKLKLVTPIIALTANSLEEEKQKCLEIGMNYYLTKPFDRDVFIEILSKYIN